MHKKSTLLLRSAFIQAFKFISIVAFNIFFVIYFIPKNIFWDSIRICFAMECIIIFFSYKNHPSIRKNQ